MQNSVEIARILLEYDVQEEEWSAGLLIETPVGQLTCPVQVSQAKDLIAHLTGSQSDTDVPAEDLSQES